MIALQRYNQEVSILIEESAERLDATAWDNIKSLTKEKNEAIKEAEDVSKQVSKQLKELEAVLNKPDLQATEAIKEQAKNNVKKVLKDVEAAKKELDNEKKKSNIADKYWDKVKTSRQHFSDELQILFPNVVVEQKKLNVDEADLDLFVLHAVSKVLFYQKELAKLETIGEDRLKTAIEAAKREGKYEFLTHEQICQELEKAKRKLEEDYKKKVLKIFYKLFRWKLYAHFGFVSVFKNDV